VAVRPNNRNINPSVNPTALFTHTDANRLRISKIVMMIERGYVMDRAGIATP
jgi:hypothetical protein